MIGSNGSSRPLYQNFRGLVFGFHHAGPWFSAVLDTLCGVVCIWLNINMFFPHLIPCDYGPHGMYHSDPGLQFIQLNWSEGMLVRVQTCYLDYLNS